VEASVSSCGQVGAKVVPADLSIERWEASSPLAGHKTLSRLQWDLALRRANESGSHDVVLVDASDRILETSVANVWVVREGVAWTPPAPARCLPGVMRGWLLEHLDAVEVPALERDVTISDLENADEVWISNAVIGLRRVGLVAGRRWQSWPLFDRVAAVGMPAPGWPRCDSF
jgi:branched-subunit amino acid aminotransferase/4-amino-4-deoxychorismate lyase